MPEINNIRPDIIEMSKLALKMLQDTFKAFMEHDMEILAVVLQDEHRLNDLEKEINTKIFTVSKTLDRKEEKAQLPLYAEIVGDIELIGDYCKDILERVQIKIEEKLLFSEEAVKEYTRLYKKTEESLQDVVTALLKKDKSLLRKILKEAREYESLMGDCRDKHDQRLINGLCSPMACNMFLNILDFTGQISHHTKSIAASALKLK